MVNIRISGFLKLAVALVVSVPMLRAQVLYNFGGKSGDPLNPSAPGVLTQGINGDVYSTSPNGGTNSCGGGTTCGTVFKIAPNGMLTVLYDFDDYHGANPHGGLTLGTDGNFYGTTASGGSSGLGTVFRITPHGNLNVLYNFSGFDDGAYQQAPPIQGSDGNWYGTTAQGGAFGSGTIYTFTSSSFATLYPFDGVHGAYPYAPLLLGEDGNLWGTTTYGGDGHGTIFMITIPGVLTVLHNFDQGDTPNIVQASDGNFYGTILGTNAGAGSIYRMTASGIFTILHNFDGTDGSGPVGVMQATDGNLYGVAEMGGKENLGTAWRMTLSGSLTPLLSFSDALGSDPQVVPLQHTSGVLYGEASADGKFNGGTFLEGNLRLKPFAGLIPTTGAVGTSVGILGQGLRQTTAVSFNGASAIFSVVSDTFLTTTVPASASTGLVTVTTSAGELISNRQFVVQ